MAAERKTDHPFGLGGKLEQTLAEGDRHDTVLLPVQHQKRRIQADNALIGVKRVLHEPAYGHERVGRGADIDSGCEGRIENKGADVTVRGQRRGDSGAERLAPQHDPFGRVTRGRKIVGCDRIANKSCFARFAA